MTMYIQKPDIPSHWHLQGSIHSLKLMLIEHLICLMHNGRHWDIGVNKTVKGPTIMPLNILAKPHNMQCLCELHIEICPLFLFISF